MHIEPVNNECKGFMTFVLFFLIVFGLLGLYLGYGWYMQKYYITLYDGKITRYLDIPPFSERMTSANEELKGRCVLTVGTATEQAFSFWASMASKYGYVFTKTENGAVIEIRKGYNVKFVTEGNTVKISWQPVLTETLKKKYKKLFGKN